jgi:hypothetical protein
MEECMSSQGTKPRIRLPSAAMIVACLALFVALGGGTYAAVKLKANSVKTKNLKNGAVKEAKIADGAVSTRKLADAAVTSGKLADGAVTSGKLAPGAVGTKRAVASGTATNSGSQGLGSNVCALFNLAAPGVQPGDVVAITPTLDLSGTPGAIADVDYDGTAIPAGGQLQVRVCNASTGYTVNAGQLKVDWVAFR